MRPNCHQYSGGPTSESLLEANLKKRLAGQKIIPCPGECGGKAILQPLMTVIRDGVKTHIHPVRCLGSCREEKVLPSGNIAKSPKVYQLTELPGEPKPIEPKPPEPEKRETSKVARAKQQARVRKRNLDEQKRAENWARFYEQASMREIVTLPVFTESDILGGALDRA